jgi:hypothetical protein
VYRGNPLLKSETEKTVYTNEMKKEFVKCYSDILHFGETYCYIVTNDYGKILIKFWDFQKKILKALMDTPEYKNELGEMEKKRHCIILMPRQQSKTTISAIYLLHYVIFNQDKTVILLANKEKTAIEILDKIKQMYENLPLWLQPGLREWNKKSIILGNNSRIIASTTSSSSIRGYTVNCLFLDEFAFVPQNQADEFMNSVYPTISTGKTAKIIIVSTPKGMNHFYDIWNNAVKGKNQYFPIKVNWWEHPDRNDEFKRNIIRDRGVSFFAQEFQCASKDSHINIKDKNTGIVKNITMEDLYVYGNDIFRKEA